MNSIRQIVEQTTQPLPRKDQLEGLVVLMHSSGILYSEALREFRRRYISHILDQCHGNQLQAAKILGMHRNTLARWIADLKIDADSFRTARRFPVQSTPHPRYTAEERQIRQALG